jgi:hypothetical protein
MGHYHNVTQALHRLNQKPALNLIGLRQKLMMRSQTNE